MTSLPRLPLLLASLLIATSACATDDGGDLDAEDGENDVASGKGDSPAEGSADAKSILALANDVRMQDHDYDEDVGLSKRVAEAITAYRDGTDREFGTADDKPFKTLAELDAIPYLGPVAMTAMKTYARAHANPTTLRFDLVADEFVNHEHREVSLDSLNTQLRAAGLPEYPKQLTVGMRDGREVLKLLASFEAVKTKLHRELDMDFTWDPSDYKNICYSGDIKRVADSVEGLRYSMFSIYMGIQGERRGTYKKVFVDGGESAWLASQEEQENTAQVAAWKAFNTASTDYLMMTDGGQQGDGTEFFAVTIKKCQ